MPSKTKKAAELARSSQEDVPMTDAPAVVPELDLSANEDPRISIVRLPIFWAMDCSSWLLTYQLPGSSETAASFQFLNEDHTLGNALRYIIMKKCVQRPIIFQNDYLLNYPPINTAQVLMISKIVRMSNSAVTQSLTRRSRKWMWESKLTVSAFVIFYSRETLSLDANVWI
jgi:DNA-directed RNA polymerase I and III subunit RPAC2